MEIIFVSKAIKTGYLIYASNDLEYVIEKTEAYLRKEEVKIEYRIDVVPLIKNNSKNQ
jgi:hypothetical protein